jgi:aldose 1-epimerase
MRPTLFFLTNPGGLSISISNLGGVITQIFAPDRDGKMANICLGFDDLSRYLTESPYFGALIGRYGNRIARGRFALDGRVYQLDTNNGPHHLHGGVVGFDKRIWDARQDGNQLTMKLVSEDGDQGYPGRLEVTVVYTLTADNALDMAFEAVTDKPTPVNLTQHCYFNLAGQGDILGHELMIDADGYLPIDETSIPFGVIAPAEQGPFDFRSARSIGSMIGTHHSQLANGGGYDHTFVLNKAAGLRLAARVREPGSGRVLELWTEEPGVQFYSGNFLDGSLENKGWRYIHRGGFCLEPQHFPNSPNQPNFPNVILRPGARYRTKSAFRFTADRSPSRVT